MPEELPELSISSSTSLNPDEIARRTFPAARKGVDGEAVRRFLETVADDVRALLEREAQLRRRVAEAERKAAEPPVLDEATLTQAVGAETARVLQSAHDAAREVVARAEARAAELVTESEAEVAQRRADAQAESTLLVATAAEEAATTAAAAAAEAGAVRSAAQAEAEAIVEAAREDAVALLDTTKQRCRQTVRDARRLRNSVLSDLVERRRALFVQLEQLRSGRDSLVEVVSAVEATVEELKARLDGAEHGARIAAAEAGDLAETLVDEEVETLLEPDGDLEEHAELLGEELEEEEEEEEEQAVEAGVGADTGEVVVEAEAVVDLGEEALADEEEQPAHEVRARDTAASHRSVGELFARIRAARSSEGEPAEAASGGDEEGVRTIVEEVGAAQEPATAETEVVQAPEGPHDTTPAESEPGGEVLVGREPMGAEVEDALAEGEGDPDAAARARRDELLEPVVAKLARALKRALQDDQNELLNALRHASGQPELDVLLPAEPQSERYTQAASGALSEGWLVGRGWLRPDGADEGELDDAEIAAEAAETGRALALELAAELSSLLRHRVVESLQALGEAGEAAQDAAGAAYREWKGPRVEGIAGDFATRAFATGAVAAAEGTIVRWVVDDGKPCPDCDDNALAGEQRAGEAWPTGQLYPPVHPGCRCLLVATTD
ncbi:MAG TPA: DivIVA domain-containing protein [Acidimicrobiales bacterium]|nr:DivIVA domain-containing protein [Acidimicrobiales bacterium]